MISDAPRSRASAKVDDERGTGDSPQFAAEVPDIIAGLGTSQSVGPVTAVAARQFIVVGHAGGAFAFVPNEVDGSWR